MKLIRQPVIAFLYNTRSVYPDPERPETQRETDFDDAETIAAMREALQSLGAEVLSMEADARAAALLYERRGHIDLALNYSMGRRGAARYAQIPAVLELIGIPYTGSDPLVQGILQDKSRMQPLLAAHGVPVPPTAVLRHEDDAAAHELAFPLLVKPACEGSSAGITRQSLVRTEQELRVRARELLSTFGGPVLAQSFLTGREFSIPMVGNPPRILPIIEPDFTRLPSGFPPLDTLEVKWYFEEETAAHHLDCPARVEPALESELQSLARRTWDALGIRDWCRIDVRADSRGRLHVLDVNSPPGMIPPRISQTSYLPLAGRAAGLSYEEVLASVLRAAAARHGLEIFS